MSAAALQRMTLAGEYHVGIKAIHLPVEWGFRHLPAFSLTPSESLLTDLHKTYRDLLKINDDTEVVVLDYMAGGG